MGNDFEMIHCYEYLDAFLFPFEIDIFQEVFQYFDQYITLEKVQNGQSVENYYQIIKRITGTDFSGLPIKEIIDAVGGLPYIFRLNGNAFGTQTGADADKSPSTREMLRELDNVYRKHPEWFKDEYIDMDGHIGAKELLGVTPERSKRWQAFRSVLKKSQLNELMNVHKNAPKMEIMFVKDFF